MECLLCDPKPFLHENSRVCVACREESPSDVGCGGRKNLTIKILSWEGQNICCSQIRKKNCFCNVDWLYFHFLHGLVGWSGIAAPKGPQNIGCVKRVQSKPELKKVTFIHRQLQKCKFLERFLESMSRKSKESTMRNDVYFACILLLYNPLKWNFWRYRKWWMSIYN
jgi:hypothetical protein